MSNYKTKRNTARASTTIKLGGVDNQTGKPNPTSVEGYFLGTKEVSSKQMPGKIDKIHSFQTSKGQVDVWGKTNLDRLLTSEHLNQMCLVTYTGKGQPSPGKQAPYLYELKYDETNTLDNDAPSITASEDSDEYDSGDSEEESLFGESAEQDEVVAAQPRKPAAPVKVNADRVARVNAMLGKR